MEVLYWLLYHIFHFLLSCYIWAGLLFGQIKDLVTREEDVEGLKKIASGLKKIPSHLAIVLEGDYFQEELAKVICWSMCVGVSDITIFDPTGNSAVLFSYFLRKNQKRIQNLGTMCG
jgi:hypothetical protein